MCKPDDFKQTELPKKSKTIVLNYLKKKQK